MPSPPDWELVKSRVIVFLIVAWQSISLACLPLTSLQTLYWECYGNLDSLVNAGEKGSQVKGREEPWGITLQNKQCRLSPLLSRRVGAIVHPHREMGTLLWLLCGFVHIGVICFAIHDKW